MCWQALRGKDTWCPYSVTFPQLAFTGPNTRLQTPAAHPINHCRLTQYNRKFAEGAQLGHYQCSVPIYFASALFSEADVWRDKIDVSFTQNRDYRLWCCSPQYWFEQKSGTHLNLGLLSIHSQIAVAHLRGKCPQLRTPRARSVFVPGDLLSCNFGEEVTL